MGRLGQASTGSPALGESEKSNTGMIVPMGRTSAFPVGAPIELELYYLVALLLLSDLAGRASNQSSCNFVVLLSQRAVTGNVC